MNQKDFPNLKFVHRLRLPRKNLAHSVGFIQSGSSGNFREIKDLNEARGMGRDSAKRVKKLLES